VDAFLSPAKGRHPTSPSACITSRRRQVVATSPRWCFTFTATTRSARLATAGPHRMQH
jgi:hypothetical protein